MKPIKVSDVRRDRLEERLKHMEERGLFPVSNIKPNTLGYGQTRYEVMVNYKKIPPRREETKKNDGFKIKIGG